MKESTITKIETAISILQEAREEIPANERFYNDYYANMTLFDLILQLENYTQKAKDTNAGLTSIDVLKRDVGTR